MNSDQANADCCDKGGTRPVAPEPKIRLEAPSEKYLDSFFEAMAEFEREGNRQIPENLTQEQFPAYVQSLHDLAMGRNLKKGYVPSKEFWIIDADGYAGRIILGLTFWPGPERVGNHVGYAVRPSKRRRGYATKALQCLVEEARKLSIKTLMPECAASNVASRKVIESNGGVLFNGEGNNEAGQEALRFVIALNT